MGDQYNESHLSLTKGLLHGEGVPATALVSSQLSSYVNGHTNLRWYTEYKGLYIKGLDSGACNAHGSFASGGHSVALPSVWVLTEN